ncbi:MAG: gliding motility-associated C-terminal domain-containing protein, partial [Bacteroidota bacterium]
YIYNWNNGSTSQDLTNLTAATYIVTVTDNNGCKANTSASVNQPAGALSVSSVLAAVKCFGDATGAINITTSAGTAPYSYQWNNGSTSEDLNGLNAGSYTVTITDANGCILNNTLFVTQPSQTLSTTAIPKNILCFGENTGSIDLTVNGGTSAYTYLWNNGATTEDPSGLNSGTYTVTVTDANSCKVTSIYTLNQPAETLSATAVQTDLNCHDIDDAVIDLTVTGGTTPYQYIWSNGTSAQDISALSAGTYSATVTDANGCRLNRTYTIIYNAETLTANSVNQAAPCNGDATGAIDLEVNGGTAPFQFNWSNSATSEDLTNVTSGSYSVTVTDKNGCTTVYSTGVSQPAAALAVSAFKTDELCNNDHGALIDLTVSGGSTPYQYNWNDGTTGEDLNGITAGTYDVTITDSHGCTWTNSFAISGPPAPLAASVSSIDPSCFGENTGSITLALNGGTNPYQVTWNDGTTGEALTNVPSGIYIATIKDANQCELLQTITLNQPAQPLAATAQSQNIDCFSNSTGTIDITAAGGTAPYTYTWSNGATTATNTQLTAGNYDYTITDAQNCIYSGTATITQPVNFLQGTVTASASLCHGDATGNIDLNISGGTPGYSFVWSNGATTEDINTLTTGDYTVTVTDANNCIYSNTYTVTEPQASLTATTSSVTNVSCSGNASGLINVNIAGGTTPYIYSWSNGATTASISQLPAGTYNLMVTDLNGCTTTSSIIITEPIASLATNGNITAVDCKGSATGSFDLTVTGGTSPYQYNWSNGITTEDLSAVEAGTYSVTVTDNQQCVSTLSFTINEPQNALTNTMVVTDIACTGNTTGAIQTQVLGGTSPYVYQWSNGTSSASISNVVSGIYIFTVTDAHGCIQTDSATVAQPAAAIQATATPQNLHCTGDHSGAVNLNVTGGTGNYHYHWNNNATTMNISGLNAGSYTVTVTDANNCSSVQTVQIAQPQQMLVVGSTVSNVSCFGMNNGSVTLNITGGDPAYNILWSNGGTSNALNNLSPGVYSVSVTDGNGCVVNSSYNLLQPTATLNMTATATASSCLQGTAGAVHTTMSGGTQPYQYLWNTGGTSSSLNNIYAGTYTVTATDVNGCSAMQSITINDQSVLNLNQSGPVEICVGTTTTLSVTAIPGVQYQWYFNNVPLIGATTSSFTTPAAGTYSLTATTPCGNYTSTPVRVVTRSLGTLSISNSFIICPGEKVQLIAGGGSTYAWTPISGLSNPHIPNPVAAPKRTTEYTVTVTDDFGCKATASVTVSVLCDTLDVPNGFSPNNDGTNDYFVIDGLSQYPDNTLYIYNRWGNLVYKMHEYDNRWDGTSNVNGIYMSRTLPNGTYYYILDLANDQKPLNGFVVLKK